ncbi:tyrosine-protein phosphatase [uncultured Brevundimonas sp.]|uniref:tyrosine-protein phosphatase n=1 Tax=uncultured Brevundimonas sp. TaxID=213418 RepID=UPI0030ED9F38|tara:strand:+ start:63251 stop:64030 length:780 start_codon:yes stop_codon:yes gene_type:complete
MTDARLLRFDALDNFRDYGDYAVPGSRVRAGRLFRSAHHARASEADLQQLGALDIGTVVDLRRPSERRRQPSRRPPGFTGRLIESEHDDGGEAPHITFLKSGDLTEESGRRFMSATYRRLAFEPAHIDLFRRYFQALGQAEGAVLIHCAAGKDRTGLLAALTHRLLGVGRDDMIADYLLTNTAVDLQQRAPAIARQMAEMTGRSPSHDAVVAFLGVEPAYLEAALSAIESDSGTLETYLERVLGVDGALRDRITARLMT